MRHSEARKAKHSLTVLRWPIDAHDRAQVPQRGPEVLGGAAPAEGVAPAAPRGRAGT
jgi:hypothetical protein